MTCAFDELYLPLAQRILGDFCDYAVNELHYQLNDIFQMFLASGIAHQFEIGNPHYVAGKNGCEVAREVIERCTGQEISAEDIMYVDKSPEYWIGWILAYYQWESSHSFQLILSLIAVDELYAMYHVFHEMDPSAFVDTMNKRYEKAAAESRLKRLRMYANYSQSQLANKSGVPLRQIQLFEQNQRDIRKTQGSTLLQLARALHCTVEDLIS